MAVISGGKIIEGSGFGHPLTNAGVPGAGTDEVQTITFGGTPTDIDLFRLSFEGFTTTDIEWTNTNDAALIADIDAALESLQSIGTGGVVVADGTLTAGIGTVTVTFSGANLAKRVQPLIGAVPSAAYTTSGGTLAVSETTPGVTAAGLGAPKGAKLIDTTNGVDYINTGTAEAPTWTKTGTQA